MSNETLSPSRIKWLGGREYLVTDVTSLGLPYKYLVVTEDQRFKAHIRADDPMAYELELLLKGEA